MFVPMLLEGSEWLIVIVIVVVLIFGANKIPDLAKSLGRAQGEFQKGKVESEMEVAKLRAQAGTPAAAQAPAPSEHDKLMKAASELGIPTDGKTDDEIRAAMKDHLA